MASNSDFAALVQLGHDLTDLKMYAVSVTALWVYDYLLTFADEVRYAWKTERILVFILFLISRYLPPVFQTWVLITQHYVGYTAEGCRRSGFLQIVYYTCITAAAQIVLAQRAYAVTGKNKWAAGILYTIFTVQLCVGIFMAVWSSKGPITDFPQIPLDAYRMCLPRLSRALTVLQMSISLSFDVAVFLLIIMQAHIIRSRYRGISGPNVLDRVSRDAEIYFAVIATSHFVIVLMFALARSGIGPIPIVGNAVFIPMMISRMIISLKKVASSRQTHMGVDVSDALPMNLPDTYATRQTEGIRLSTLRD